MERGRGREEKEEVRNLRKSRILEFHRRRLVVVVVVTFAVVFSVSCYYRCNCCCQRSQVPFPVFCLCCCCCCCLGLSLSCHLFLCLRHLRLYRLYLSRVVCHALVLFPVLVLYLDLCWCHVLGPLHSHHSHYYCCCYYCCQQYCFGCCLGVVPRQPLRLSVVFLIFPILCAASRSVSSVACVCLFLRETRDSCSRSDFSWNLPKKPNASPLK